MLDRSWVRSSIVRRFVTTLIAAALALVACSGSDDSTPVAVDDSRIVVSNDGFIKDLAVLPDGRLVLTATRREPAVFVVDPDEPTGATVPLEFDAAADARYNAAVAGSADILSRVPFALQTSRDGRYVLGIGSGISVWQTTGELVRSLPSEGGAAILEDGRLAIAGRHTIEVMNLDSGLSGTAGSVEVAAIELEATSGLGVVIRSEWGDLLASTREATVLDWGPLRRLTTGVQQLLEVDGDRVAVVAEGELIVLSLSGDTASIEATMPEGSEGWDGAFVGDDQFVLVPGDDGDSGPIFLYDLTDPAAPPREIRRTTQVPVAVEAGPSGDIYVAVQYRVAGDGEKISKEHRSGIERWTAQDLDETAVAPDAE